MRNIVNRLSNVIGKTSVLMEAMPYLQAFRGKIFVIKTGGMALSDPKLRTQLLQDLVFLNLAGIHPVLVHGAGPEITQKLKGKGIPSQFVNGLRVTDRRTLRVVETTLQAANRKLVSELKALGWKAVGLSGARNQLLKAKRLKIGRQDIGLVGKIHAVHASPIRQLLSKGIIPVIAPTAAGRNGQTYNVNADQAAAALAGGLRAEKFVLVTDVLGIFQNERHPNSLISTLSVREAKQLIQAGTVQSGMIPKTEACIQALRAGVHKTHMIDIQIPHGLLLEIFTYQGIGTEIVP